MLVLPSLLLLFFEITTSVQDSEKFMDVTIPQALESVSVWMAVQTTECSVTCGIGSKLERRCLVDRSGIDKNCEVVRVECLSNWLCGMQLYTVKAGHRFSMDCQIAYNGTVGGRALYYWRVAMGFVTTMDSYFQPLNVKNSTIVFESIQEEDAGTYRCDVQREDDLKLVKRSYFGVQVITTDIIDINFHKYLISKEKLASLAGGVTTHVVKKKGELYGGTYTYVGIGCSVGILVGIIVVVLIRYTCKS
ncbi:transmembrane protein 81, partial [Pristimantis euphronides]